MSAPLREPTLTDTVRAWRDYRPRQWSLPHPSLRNVTWFKRNPWFVDEVLPTLRERIRALSADVRAP